MVSFDVLFDISVNQINVNAPSQTIEINSKMNKCKKKKNTENFSLSDENASAAQTNEDKWYGVLKNVFKFQQRIMLLTLLQTLNVFTFKVIFFCSCVFNVVTI